MSVERPNSPQSTFDTLLESMRFIDSKAVETREVPYKDLVRILSDIPAHLAQHRLTREEAVVLLCEYSKIASVGNQTSLGTSSLGQESREYAFRLASEVASEREMPNDR
jgi:hypothetical protein